MEKIDWCVVLGVITAAAFGGLVVVGLDGREPASPGTGSQGAPHVSESVLEAALGSPLPDRITLSDEVEYFERRLQERPGEAFSQERLVAAHVLRFRAYGRLADLQAAERYLAEAEGAGWSEGTGGGSGGGSGGLLTSRASIHLARHEFTEARRAANEARRHLYEDEESTRLRLFDTRWAAGGYDRAAALLEPRPEDVGVGYLAREARVLDGLGLTSRARDNMRAVVERVRAFADPMPVQAWAWVESGHFELHSGDPRRAVAAYMQALDVLPGNPAALEGLAAVAHGVDRNLDVAAQLYRRAIAHGAHLEVMLVLAAIESERGHGTSADSLRAEFVRRATRDARHERWYLRPLAFLLADRPETVCRALGYAERDLDDRKDRGAWDALAWVRYRTGDLVGAYQASREATAWGAPEPPIALRAGLIARAYGDADRAQRLLGAALEGRIELSGADIRDAEEGLSARPGPPPNPVDPSTRRSRNSASPSPPTDTCRTDRSRP